MAIFNSYVRHNQRVYTLNHDGFFFSKTVLHLLAIRGVALELSQAPHHIGHDALDGVAQDLLVADVDLLLELAWNPLPHLGRKRERPIRMAIDTPIPVIIILYNIV